MADLRLGRMGTDGLTGRPIIRQIAYWQGASQGVGALLTLSRSPGGARRDPMLLSPARGGLACRRRKMGKTIGGATRG